MLRARTERMEVICEGAEYWAARFETEEQCEWLGGIDTMLQVHKEPCC